MSVGILNQTVFTEIDVLTLYLKANEPNIHVILIAESATDAAGILAFWAFDIPPVSAFGGSSFKDLFDLHVPIAVAAEGRLDCVNLAPELVVAVVASVSDSPSVPTPPAVAIP